MTKRSVIAVFDFDETLITKDSLLDFAQHSIPLPIFLMKSALFSYTLVEFKLKRISNQTAKERFLSLFFGNMSLEDFNTLCEQYTKRLDNITNSEAIKKVAWHKKQGHKIVIVSASISNWIQPWASQHGITEVISSEIEIKNGRVTGKLKGKNCHGPEKPRRFLKAYPKRDSYELIVYGDGKSDKEMFKLADKYYEKNFN